jgi:hypothetical protein
MKFFNALGGVIFFGGVILLLAVGTVLLMNARFDPDTSHWMIRSYRNGTLKALLGEQIFTATCRGHVIYSGGVSERTSSDCDVMAGLAGKRIAVRDEELAFSYGIPRDSPEYSQPGRYLILRLGPIDGPNQIENFRITSISQPWWRRWYVPREYRILPVADR